MNSWIIAAVALTLVFSNASPAHANLDLDRKYNLQTIGFLRAWDNMDGLFGEYVDKAYKNFFYRQSQYLLQDLSKADKILERSDLPYSKLLDDPEILRQISKTFKTESLIRTKVIKEGPTYRFVLDWLVAPRMDLLATETFSIKDPTTLNQTLGVALQNLLRKIPFRGQVNGRDGDSVTINIGAFSGVHKGDIIKLGTIDEVKVHPLLHAIVDWKINTTGKLTVTSVEDGMAFCKILEEEPSHTVARYQKVLDVLPGPSDPEPREGQGSVDGKLVIEAEPEDEDTPRLGWASPALGFGILGRQSGVSEADSVAGIPSKKGDGFSALGRVDGELWLTNNWHLNAGLAYGLGFFSQSDIVATTSTTPAEAPSTSVVADLSQIKLAAGYRFFPIGGLIAALRVGYRSTTWSFPTDITERLGSVSVYGPSVGMATEFALRKDYGLQLNAEFGVFSFAKESGFNSGEVAGTSDAQVYFAFYNTIAPKIRLRLGLDVMVNSINFVNGATLSHRSILVLPSAIFLF